MKQLLAKGLKVKTLKQLQGKLLFEPPVALSNAFCKANVQLGKFTYVGENSILKFVKIGRYCSIASHVSIGPTEHPTDRLSTHLMAFRNMGPFKFSDEFAKTCFPAPIKKIRQVTIGHDVWIGEGALIRRGVTIGNGAVVAAHAVVGKDVEPYMIVGGVPAKPIRKRFDDATIARIEALAWWNYDLSPYRTTLDISDIAHTLDTLESEKAAGRLKPLHAPLYRFMPVAPDSYTLAAVAT